MLNFIFECRYCGYKWTKTYYYKPSLDHVICEKCKDKNIDIKEYEKVDYYGSKDE